MKRIIMIVLAICLVSILAWGNAASPYERPDSNVVLFDDDTGIVLAEEWVKFTIDKDNSNSQVDVVYNLVNEDRADAELDIMFLAPYFNIKDNEIYEESFSVEIDGVEITEFEIKEAGEIPENWKASYSMEIVEPVDGRLLERRLGISIPSVKSGGSKGIQFTIDIDKGESKTLKMSYKSEEGYYSFDDVVNDVYTHIYFLTPAKFWDRDTVVNLEIEFPDEGYEMHSNIDLEKVSATNYSTTLTGLPDEEWSFSYVDTTGLVYGTNKRMVHNYITWGIVALTFIVGLILRKRNKLLGTLIVLGVVAELFLFRPTYGTMFLIFYIGPAFLIAVGLVAAIVYSIKYYSNKRKTHL